MSVDKDTVKRIASLARLAVADEKLAPMADALNGIFNWVEMLNEVNIEGVPAMTSVVAQKLKWREDKVTLGVHLRQLRLCVITAIQTFKELSDGPREKAGAS